MIDPHQVEVAAWLDRYNDQGDRSAAILILITTLAAGMVWLRLQAVADEHQKNVFFVVVGTPLMVIVMRFFREMYYPQVQGHHAIKDFATRVTKLADLVQTLLTEPVKYMADELAADGLQVILACFGLYWLKELKIFNLSGRRFMQDVEFRYINYMAFVFVAFLIMPTVKWAGWILYVFGKFSGIIRFFIMCTDVVNWCYSTETESSDKEKVTIKDGTEPVKLWEKIMTKPGMEDKKYETITLGCPNKTARQNALLPYLEEHLVVDDQRTKK